MVDTGQGGFATLLDFLDAGFEGHGMEASNEILPNRGEEPRQG